MVVAARGLFTEDHPSPHLSELVESAFDTRQAKVVKTGEFWHLYKDDIKELFMALGKEELWSDTPEGWLPHAKEQWIGAEQASKDKERFTLEQTEAALEILEKMGFTGELVAPAGHYQQAVILGATTPALHKRVSLALKDGITVDEMIILAGQRPIGERDGTIEQLQDYAGDDAWAERVLRSSEDNPELNLTETEMARIAFLRSGHVRLRESPCVIDLLPVPTGEIKEDIGQQPIRTAREHRFALMREVDGETLEQQAAILNGIAVARRQGDPRPTTASTIIEWLAYMAPRGGTKNTPSRVLVVSGNPHTLRTVEEMNRIVKAFGREDIMLLPAGTVPANADMPATKLKLVQTALGEITRLVDRDPTVHPVPDEVARLKAEFAGSARILSYINWLLDRKSRMNDTPPRIYSQEMAAWVLRQSPDHLPT